MPLLSGEDTTADLGVAEQAFAAKTAEAQATDSRYLRAQVGLEAAMAGYNLFDARVRHATTDEGEAELRAQLRATPPPTTRAEERQGEDFTEAIEEGVRYRRAMRGLDEQVRLGALTPEEAKSRAEYPPPALAHHRRQAALTAFDVARGA
jgi:hypothetical protein